MAKDHLLNAPKKDRLIIDKKIAKKIEKGE